MTHYYAIIDFDSERFVERKPFIPANSLRKAGIRGADMVYNRLKAQGRAFATKRAAERTLDRVGRLMGTK